jgi:2-methylisocitrate lyase-like PEP mutase family enzyme
MLYKSTDSLPPISMRSLLSEDRLIVAGAAWDGITATLVEEIGMEAVAVGSWQVASTVGVADANLMTKGHMMEAVRRVRSRTRAATIVDMEDGFGNAAHIFYNVQQFELAGASAIGIEDQVSPVMSCNHVGGFERAIYDLPIAVSKVRAAVDGRTNPDTVVVARTDAEGEDVYRRAAAFAEAGADVFFATSPKMGLPELERIHNECGLPIMTFVLPGTFQERDLSYDDFEKVGVRILALSIHPFNAMLHTLRGVLEGIRDRRPFLELAEATMPHDDWAKMIGIYDVMAMQEKYLPTSKAPSA